MLITINITAYIVKVARFSEPMDSGIWGGVHRIFTKELFSLKRYLVVCL